MKTKLIFMLLALMTTNLLYSQKGLFARFSLGPGIVNESSVVNDNGLGIASKNHAIGWGISDNFAVYIGEFGTLVKMPVEEYDYLNLDAFGLGMIFRLKNDLKLSLTGAYSKVSLAHKWTEAMGNDGGTGLGMNISLNKEWHIAKHLGLGLGPQIYLLKTRDTGYRFSNVSLNFSVKFYLTAAKYSK